MKPCSWLLPVCCMVVLLVAGCVERRDKPRREITYETLRPLLLDKCASCHGAARDEGGYGVTRYLDLVSCTDEGKVATWPASREAPLLRVLERADHARLLSSTERNTLRAFVESGAPAFRGTVHDPSIIDPRSPGWHGRLVAEDHYALLRKPEAPKACGRCHQGAPVEPADVRFAAPKAPACTSCHEQAEGVLACPTCHGRGDQGAPPRDPCFFGGSARDPHQAHLEHTRFTASPLACGECHPQPEADLFAGTHTNGRVEVRFSEARAGHKAHFESEGQTCFVACHAQGGEHDLPVWESQKALDCQSCHLSPPRDHFPGACGDCHQEMGGEADSLTPGPQHLNGQVDYGRRPGCGGCHGRDEMGWPDDDAHARHRDTRLTEGIACESCHVVPAQVVSPGHMDGTVDVRFVGRAATDAASYDGATGSCTAVACHGSGESAPTPLWHARGDNSQTCEGCHATPPPPPHAQREACGGGLCHGAEVRTTLTGFEITDSGQAVHIDGHVR